MTQLLSYRADGRVATITLDDGKVNALSAAMLADIGAAFDRAEADGMTVLLTGRPGIFSAGFDLLVLRAGGDPARQMVRRASSWRSGCFPSRPGDHRLPGARHPDGLVPAAVGRLPARCRRPVKITANEVPSGWRSRRRPSRSAGSGSAPPP